MKIRGRIQNAFQSKTGCWERKKGAKIRIFYFEHFNYEVPTRYALGEVKFLIKCTVENQAKG